ncbi:DUF5959 family protein [Promicromonospora sp. NPDC019610]|uniref:DUF5959 family protein n=1 Tax=Promicromonospora sp. NPDC019610 TaxID=3364405 RepID=UPI00378D9241
MVEIPYGLAQFSSDGGAISLQITREVVNHGEVSQFELLVSVETEFVSGSGRCYIDHADLIDLATFITALDSGKSANWREGRKGFGLSGVVVSGQALDYSYEEIRVKVIDDDTGVAVSVTAYREDAWIAEAKKSLNSVRRMIGSGI